MNVQAIGQEVLRLVEEVGPMVLADILTVAAPGLPAAALIHLGLSLDKLIQSKTEAEQLRAAEQAVIQANEATNGR